MAVGSNTLGLLFKVSVDSSGAQTELQKLPQAFKSLEKSANDFGASLRSSLGPLGQFLATFGPLGLAAAAAAGAIQLCTRAAIDLGSELHDLSQTTGISVENLSALRVAAATSGSTLEQVTAVFVRFQHAALEGGPQAQTALARFGLTARDVADDSTKAFDTFLKSFNQMAPTAQRNADSMALFGRNARELLPTFTELSGGLEDARKKADALGLTFHEDLAKNADEAGDAIDILKLQINAIGVSLGENLIKPLGELVQTLSRLLPYLEPVARGIGAILAATQNLNDLRATVNLLDHLRNVLGDIRQLTGKAPEAFAPNTFGNLLQQKKDADKLKADALMNAYLKGNATGDWSDWTELNDQGKGPKAPRAPRAVKTPVDEAAQQLKQAEAQTTQEIQDEWDKRLANLEDNLKQLNKAIIDASDIQGLVKWKFAIFDFAQVLHEQTEGIVQDFAKIGKGVPGGFGDGQIPGLPKEIPLPKPDTGGFFEDLKTSLGESTNAFQTWGQTVGKILGQFAQATEQAFAAFILTGKLSGQIFKQLVAQIIASLAIESTVKAIFEYAEAAAAFAVGDIPGGIKHTAAAHIYTAVAVAAGVAGLAIGAAGGLGGGTAGAADGGGFGGSSAAPGTVTVNQGSPGTLGIQLLSSINNHLSNITTAPPGDILQRGADQNPMAVGQANNEASRRDGSISREFLQISGLRTA